MSLMHTMMECPFLLMHLSYYMISYYLNILHSNLQDNGIHPKTEVKLSHYCPNG